MFLSLVAILAFLCSRLKVEKLWEDIPLAKDENGDVERLSCWEYVFADSEFLNIIGGYNAEKGKRCAVRFLLLASCCSGLIFTPPYTGLLRRLGRIVKLTPIFLAVLAS